MDAGTTLMTLMHQGGWVMWALLVFSLISLATALERALVIRNSKTDLKPLVGGLRKALLRERSVPMALKACRRSGGSVAKVAESGLRRFERSPAQIEKALERHALGEVRRLRRGLGFLAVTATTAPLLGFLGTVTGMMDSFGALVEFGMTNPTMVAQGIQEALTTTAAGLTVAVPVQLAHSALASRVDRMTHEMEDVGNFLLEAREEIGSVA